MKLYLALFLWAVPMTAMKVSSVNLDRTANMSHQEIVKQKVLVARANNPVPVNVTIGYASGITTEGSAGFTRTFCTKICNSDVMIGQGYNLALFAINPNNPSWGVGNALANMEVFSASKPLGEATNVVNYKNTGRKSFLKKIVFNPLILNYDLNEELCVAINIIGISGVFTFQLRWVDESVTPTTDYGPPSAFQPSPEPAASMIQFADHNNGATSFSVQNFEPYKLRATFCQRNAQTNYNVRLSVVGDELSAFNSFLCPGYDPYCDQLSGFVTADTSGSSFNFLTATKGTKLNVPDVQVAIFGFGGFNDRHNDGTYTLIFSEF